jgi:hypothetical protein
MRLLTCTTLAAALALAIGCSTKFNIQYVPQGVEQRIGANLLGSAQRVWRCEGGERYALVENGEALYIASRDFIVRKPERGKSGDVFGYEHSMTYGTIVADFLVPHDDGPLYASYATPYVGEKGSSQVTVGNYVYTSTRWTLFTPRIRLDRCWPDKPGVDHAASAQAQYVGTKPYNGPPPPGARHYVMSFCANNQKSSGWSGKPSLTKQQVGAAAVFADANADNQTFALGPQDVYVAGARVVVLRPDGTGFELTNPTTYLGVEGWHYERAHVPWFLTFAGQPGAYVFRPTTAAAADKPAPLPSGNGFDEQFVLGCLMEEES